MWAATTRLGQLPGQAPQGARDGAYSQAAGEPDCTFADTTRIKAELGWTAKVPIEDGVQNMLKVIDYWRDAPVWTPDSIAVATKDWFTYLGRQ